MKLLHAIILSISTLSLALGQTTTVSDGDWSSSSVWSGGIVPGSISPSDVNFVSADSIVVSDSVVTGNRNISMNDNVNVDLAVTAGSYLKVEGDYSFSQNGNRYITVEGSSSDIATLVITGSLLGDGNVHITVKNAYLRIEGDLTADNNSNLDISIEEGGIVYVKGDVDLDNNINGSFDGEGTLLVDGNLNMEGFNNDGLDGVVAVKDTMNTNIQTQPQDTIEVWGDNVDDAFNPDQRPGYPSGPAEGSYEDFANMYPDLCYYSDYCRETYLDEPLPVTWADVYVEEALGLVTVYWSTLSETDNDYFEVYKSTDAESWTSIGVVSGVGISKELLSYSLTDVETVSEVTYYRIAQVDYDGASEYSKTVVYVPGEGLTSSEGLYPNPNEGTFYVDLGEEEFLSVSIVSSKGESVVFDYSVLDNLVKVEVDPAYASGFYTVTVVTDSGVSQKNFIIK